MDAPRVIGEGRKGNPTIGEGRKGNPDDGRETTNLRRHPAAYVRVSVVICEHSMDRYDDCHEAAESVFSQTHDDIELVLVSDGDEAVCEAFHEDFGGREDVVIHCNEANLGLLKSRNNGAEAATGDVVAFLDDDAIAEESWVAELVHVYETRDLPAVGGKVTPLWVAGKPRFLPEEFYFLVGVTHRGFADGPGEVRNTNGSNLSFRREVFLDLGGFDPDVGGRKGDANLQADEPELGVRLQREYGHGVFYTPAARVGHKVFEYRTSLRWLLDRAFWQGYSKRTMSVILPGSTDEERGFLADLLFRFAPRRLSKLVRSPSVAELLQLVMLFVFTGVVGLGYLYGFRRYPPW
jgi:glycosyltransferase involved in cell wall biosynthesis